MILFYSHFYNLIGATLATSCRNRNLMSMGFSSSSLLSLLSVSSTYIWLIAHLNAMNIFLVYLLENYLSCTSIIFCSWKWRTDSWNSFTPIPWLNNSLLATHVSILDPTVMLSTFTHVYNFPQSSAANIYYISHRTAKRYIIAFIINDDTSVRVLIK